MTAVFYIITDVQDTHTTSNLVVVRCISYDLSVKKTSELKLHNKARRQWLNLTLLLEGSSALANGRDSVEL